MARRSYKFGEKRQGQFLLHLREGMRRGAAAEAVGVTRETVRQYYREDPSFRELVDLAEMDANEFVEDALYQAAISGNIPAIQTWLYNRMPERWRDQRNLKAEVVGKDGGPIEVSDARERLISRLTVLVGRTRETPALDESDREGGG